MECGEPLDLNLNISQLRLDLTARFCRNCLIKLKVSDEVGTNTHTHFKL